MIEPEDLDPVHRYTVCELLELDPEKGFSVTQDDITFNYWTKGFLARLRDSVADAARRGFTSRDKTVDELSSIVVSRGPSSGADVTMVLSHSPALADSVARMEAVNVPDLSTEVRRHQIARARSNRTDAGDPSYYLGVVPKWEDPNVVDLREFTKRKKLA